MSVTDDAVRADAVPAPAGTASPEMSGATGSHRGPSATPDGFNDPGTPQGQLGLAFKRAMVAVRRLRGRETHRPGQLSYAQYSLLHHLAQGGARSARELADLADLSPATVTQMLESLEGAALITRSRSELDRRVVLSTLTERGAEVIRCRQAQMEPRWRAAFTEFSDEELHIAARVLTRIADMFDTLQADPVSDSTASEALSAATPARTPATPGSSPA